MNLEKGIGDININRVLVLPEDVCVCVLSPCLTLCHPVDCGPLGSSVHGILQARIMEWVAISSSKGFSLPRDQTHISCVSCIGRWILHYCTTWEVVKTIRNGLCGNYHEINYTTELLHLCLSPPLSHYIKNISKKLWEWCCIKIHGVHSATAII